MARLLVVSRSMALSMRLAEVHDVTEHPFEDLGSLTPGADTDVVVLDVGEPGLAIQVLDRLRSRGHATPVLIVSGYQQAWAGLVAVDLPGVVVVPLPITRAALIAGITDLTSGARAVSSAPAPTSADRSGDLPAGSPRPPGRGPRRWAAPAAWQAP
jgi:CheY-like chemotaxis protein